MMRLDPRCIAALAAFAVIAATPAGGWLASTMVGHVLALIPLLVVIGFVLGKSLEHRLERWLALVNAGGIGGVLMATFAIAFWMIPRWLDASLDSTFVAAAKYLSLVFLAGMPLALSWRRLHPIARGVVKIEFLAMLFRMGWLYLISPDRFCNNYLLTDQVWLGRALIVVGIALSITWLIPVFFGEFADASRPPERTSVSRGGT